MYFGLPILQNNKFFGIICIPTLWTKILKNFFKSDFEQCIVQKADTKNIG